MRATGKRNGRIFAAVLLAMGMSGATAWAQQPEAEAYQAENPITIDGELSEWNLSSPLVIEDASQVIRDGDHWLGETDVSGRIYLMWDEETLYLAAEMKEATPFGAVGQLAHDMEDNFKLYLSTNPDSDPERTTYDTNDFLVYLMMDNQNWYTAFDRSRVERELLARFTSQGMESSEQVLGGYEKAFTMTETGFVFEAAFPWTDFANDYIEAYVPTAGDVINFDFCITDNDYPFPNTQASVQMNWSGSAEADKDPSQWGRVTFR